ncbi:four-carbon acid sugar kinase family protein [Agrobacterium sp. a22-2]|uniref:four-carbon acid sugar kinase family protein n=1 Tax=Agrobacterium sp. a22-2 TaxID=2283840 RepID=UPI00144683AB|nr:four-carbon acid sugar kinase family protein [Agrobacterium sp. a22-2]NKN38243.1 four-carbon acid sugar kinase family protein [Agrobacterium sp. a22-2]
MTVLVAIIADDLTGALDTGTPFVEVGLRVVVAVDVDAAAEAVATGAHVVVVNTASRSLPAADAAAEVEKAAAAFQSVTPTIVFKKIDSRLKGNVREETEALATTFGLSRAMIAPAVPDQHRFTRNGMVTGHGVPEPLPIAPLFAGSSLPIDIVDASSDADLDRAITALDGATTIAVGARGLGSALARRFGRKDRAGLSPFQRTQRTLFALGSHDPITLAQMEALLQSGMLAGSRDAPAGALAVDALPHPLPLLLRCTGAIQQDATSVAQIFAAGVTRLIEQTRPDMLMMGGGDTAHAILRRLGVQLLEPKGEIEAGIPWFEVRCANGRQIRCAVKSGGFGNAQSLIKVIEANPAKREAGQ